MHLRSLLHRALLSLLSLTLLFVLTFSLYLTDILIDLGGFTGFY